MLKLFDNFFIKLKLYQKGQKSKMKLKRIITKNMKKLDFPKKQKSWEISIMEKINIFLAKWEH